MSSGSPSRSHQRRRKSGISIIVFADTGEIIKVDDVSIDVSLQTCLISKSLVNELGVEYRAFQQGFAPDDVEDIKPIIGKVELQWHRRESGKPYTEIFDVVDTTSSLVVLRSIPEEEGSEVFSLGLEEQTEAQKLQQEKKRQERQKIRNKEKEEQAQREKQKQALSDERN